MKTYGEILRGQNAGAAAPRGDEFTGDPLIRENWEKTRKERHLIIRSMLGDLWCEKTAPQKIATVFTTCFWWVVSFPFIWAALAAVSLFIVSFALVPYDQPIEKYLGHGFDGGLGDKIMVCTAIASVLLSSFGAWSRTAGNDREIRRLRGLSNTDLLRYHDNWLAAKQRQAERDRLDTARMERAFENAELARRIGQETLKAGRILDFERRTGNVRFPE